MRIAFILSLLVCSAVAGAQTPDDAADSFTLEDLARAEAARDAALERLKALEDSGERVERELADIDADLIAAAADARRREDAATSAEIRLDSLAAAAEDARARLLADETALQDLLAALMVLGSRPPPALVTSTEDAGDAVRAAILMGDAAPELADRADTVSKEINALARLYRDIETERDSLRESEAALLARREEIEALAQEKRAARDSIADEADALRAETDRLARDAADLRGLLDALAEAAPSRPGRKPDRAGAAPSPQQPAPDAPNRTTAPDPPLPAFASRSGAPTEPARGALLRRFGAPGPGGEPQSGHTYTTRGGAQIVAPLEARVEYAGLFRSYGQILILDVGDSYLVVLAGLSAIYVETGQLVLAGEPVGRMADQKSPSPEFYLEVRRNGQPVDPDGWMQRGA